MPIRIQTPDGSIAEFPDGTPDATIQQVMAREYGGPQAGGSPRPSAGAPQTAQRPPVGSDADAHRFTVPYYDRARAAELKREEEHDKSRFPYQGPAADAYRGAAEFGDQLVRNSGAADEVNGAFSYLGQGADNLYRRATGQPVEIPAASAYQAAADRTKERQAQYAREHPGANALASLGTIAVTGKPALGSAAPTNALAAGTQAAALNAPFAFARQDGDLRARLPGALKEEALAFGGGATLNALGGYFGQMAQRAGAKPTAARQLSDMGVELTPGQMFAETPVIGPTLKRFEDLATSAPFTGAGINAARARGVESFNRAVANRALGEIGETMPKTVNVGRDGVRFVEQRISAAYDKALSPVRQVTVDAQLANDIAAAVRPSLPPQVAQDVQAVIDNTITPRLAMGRLDGRTWKDVDSELGAMIRAADNASASNPVQRYNKEALESLRDAWRGALERTDPRVAAAVAKADAATANLVRIRQAAQMNGAEEGVYTPAQLSNAVRSTDSSAGNRAFARGDALLQDITEPAKRILPSKVPDSGTAVRLGAGAGLYGGVAGGLNHGAGMAMATTDAAGFFVYSKPVQGLLNAIYRSNRPGAAQAALGRLQRLSAQNPALAPAYEQAAQYVEALRPQRTPARRQRAN